MTEEQIALARRAVACKSWRWMPGMLVVDAIGKQRIYDDVAGEPYWSTDGWLPDLTDPATLGCLLALVRDAWGNSSSLYVRLSDTRRVSDGLLGWEVNGWADAEHSPNGCPGSWRGWGYASEAEALVAALEAAP